MHRQKSEERQQHIREMQQQDQRHANELAALMNTEAKNRAEQKSKHETEMESQRRQYETKIDELELSLRRCQQTIVKLESTVLTLNTHLTEKADVEKQRDMWKAHHDSMEASKRDL